MELKGKILIQEGSFDGNKFMLVRRERVEAAVAWSGFRKHSLGSAQGNNKRVKTEIESKKISRL